ncbi:unnamed protein product, partial [Pieris macdunnoughi]
YGPSKAQVVKISGCKVNHTHIPEAETAKEVWENLSHAFDDSGLTRRVGLLRDLCSTTPSSCNTYQNLLQNGHAPPIEQIKVANNRTLSVFSKFKEFKTEAENQTECKLKCIWTDKGLEYVNKLSSDFLISAGIRYQTSTPYTPEQNGAAEKLNSKL